MIFSISNIKKKDNNSSVNNRSLFELSLEYIKSHNSYKTITESINMNLFTEAKIRGAIDILAKESIKGLKETYENYLLNRDRILNEVKNKISKDIIYKIDDDFFYNDYRYIYSNLRRVLSYSTFSTDISKESSKMVEDIEHYIAVKYISDYYKLLEEFKVYKENIETDISMICADLLGKSGPVDKNVFATSLYGYFRKYRVEMDSNITKDELLEIYDRYSSNEVEKSIITKDFNKITDDVANIESVVNNIRFNFLDKPTMNSEFTSYPGERLYLWINVVKMILDIYQMFFAARLDACLECLLTDIDILIEARKYVENRQLTDANKQ